MVRSFGACAVAVAAAILGASGCADDEAALRREVLEVARDYPELCDERPAPQSLAYGEKSALGVTPEQAFAPMTGTCSATWSWDSGPVYPPVTPARGTSLATVSVVPDPGTARVIDVAPNRRVFGCEPVMLVDADVSFVTADGNVSVKQRAALTYDRSRGLQGVQIEGTFAESAPGFRETTPGDVSYLGVSVSAMGSDCYGWLHYRMWKTGPTGITSAGGGPLGGWKAVTK